MDIRERKTKDSIIDVFLKLRREKDLKRITVKELCSEARINRSTFYAHFDDIYDLSSQVEDDVISSIVSSISGHSYQTDGYESLAMSIIAMFTKENDLMDIVFSGCRSDMFVIKMEVAIKELVFTRYPQFESDQTVNAYLSMVIFGVYYSLIQNNGVKDKAVIDTLVRLIDSCMNVLLNRDVKPPVFDSPYGYGSMYSIDSYIPNLMK